MMYPKICVQTRWFFLLLVSNASNNKIIQYGLAKMHRLKAITCFPPFTNLLHQYFVKHNAKYLTL